MKYDYSMLLGKIISKYGNRKNFAYAMKTSPATLHQKLNGIAEWKQSDIEKACKLLEIPEEKIHTYFFSV